MFNELRWQDPPTFKQYWSEVEETRRTGFAYDIGGYNTNFTTVAAPILGADGRASMAISAVTFSNHLDRPAMLRLAADMRETADELSRALGGPITHNSPGKIRMISP
jgi:DNA-binding IclR family transcriptional regulator